MTNPLPASYSMGQNYKHLLKIENKTGMSTFTSLIQHKTGSPGHTTRQEEEKEGIQIGKVVVKLFLFADNMILYMGNPRPSTKKLLELINEVRQVAG